VFLKPHLSIAVFSCGVFIPGTGFGLDKFCNRGVSAFGSLRNSSFAVLSLGGSCSSFLLHVYGVVRGRYVMNGCMIETQVMRWSMYGFVGLPYYWSGVLFDHSDEIVLGKTHLGGSHLFRASAASSLFDRKSSCVVAVVYSRTLGFAGNAAIVGGFFERLACVCVCVDI